MSRVSPMREWANLFLRRRPRTAAYAETLHERWDAFMQSGRQLSLRKVPLIRPDSKIFCMGSCFALEVKSALSARGYAVHPSENSVEVPQPGAEPFRPTGRQLVYYNTFTMLQEFEKAWGLWSQDRDDVWVVRKERAGRDTVSRFQDPYRRRVFSETKEGLHNIIGAFDDVIKKGILESNVYIFTLGLTEVWKKKEGSRYVCAEPGYGGGGGHGDTMFVQSGFPDNYANVKRLVELIHAKSPSRHIVLTVSPVPLGRTFSGNDIFAANTESKAVLRAVAGQIVREFPWVSYFPSFEICSLVGQRRGRGVYEADGRHVRRDLVAEIIDTFLDAYTAGDAPAEGHARTAEARQHP
ncbi:MAG TPA: GSCFA domain-containing protein [Candidatus Polarisedimenticolia bacterium]|nr:GSCFA domain-containing protein [Candidatus Polarisedimenticolia bacterium]